LLEKVREYGETILITKRGKPIARLVRIDEESPQRAFGHFRDDAVLVGDIVGPILDREDWL